MSRTRSLRLVMLVADSSTSMHNLKSCISSCPPRRNVSSSKPSNSHAAPHVALASTSGTSHSCNSSSSGSKQVPSEADIGLRQTALPRSKSYIRERIAKNKQSHHTPDDMQITPLPPLPQATPFPNVGNLTSFVHTREPPLFGIAKDRSPAGRNRRYDAAQEEEPIIRHDALFLKKLPSSSSTELKYRKYSQTWKEFSQKRVRPATEWGYFGAEPK